MTKYRAFGADWPTIEEAESYADRIFRKFETVREIMVVEVTREHGREVVRPARRLESPVERDDETSRIRVVAGAGLTAYADGRYTNVEEALTARRTYRVELPCHAGPRNVKGAVVRIWALPGAVDWPGDEVDG